ncbi:hypothetical protein PspLS_09918 [Pyricularia sp. CBS 133598]|nr:hypothetical protein PspLS_09918 [Pyricularia sp. CBS 133598]
MYSYSLTVPRVGLDGVNAQSMPPPCTTKRIADSLHLGIVTELLQETKGPSSALPLDLNKAEISI